MISSAGQTITLLALSWAAVAAGEPGSQLKVTSSSTLELGYGESFALVTPQAPLRLRAKGPGRLVAIVVPGRAGPTKFTGSVEVEASVQGVAAPVARESLSAPRMLGLEVSGGSFLASGPTRLSFDLLTQEQLYQLKVSSVAAIATFLQGAEGARSLPLRPEGKPKTVKLKMQEPWHFVSGCKRIRVQAPGAGVLRLFARPILPDSKEAPAVLRASGEAGRASLTITSPPELGLQLRHQGKHFASGQAQKRELYLERAGAYDFQMEGSCHHRAAMQLVFEPGGPPPEGSARLEPEQPQPGPEPAKVALASKLAEDEEKPRGAPSTPSPAPAALVEQEVPACAPAKPTPEEVVKAKLREEELVRQRVLEYLDSMVASGAIPGSELVVRQSSGLGESFAVEAVYYTLDGQPFLQDPGKGEGERVLLKRKVVPGPHTLEVSAVIKGRGSGSFAHLNNYVIRVKGEESFLLDSGRRYSALIRLEDRGGVLTPFEMRAGIQIQVRPE